MSRYTTGTPKREQDEGPRTPKFCDVYGCATHWDRNLQRFRQGAADVILTIDDGRLIARCSEHYLRDLYHAGKGRWSDFSNTDRLTSEALSAYYASDAWRQCFGSGA